MTVARVPVEGALVAADCGDHHKAAQRTGDDGRARMRLYGGRECSLVVAKPGLPTVETGPVNMCPTPGACAPTRIDLSAAPMPPQDFARENPYARAPLEYAPRTYARPSMEVAE